MFSTVKNNNLDLYDVIKNSYKDKKKQQDAFIKNGFVFDSGLSNDNEQVYYNPKEKKLVYSVAGTHNIKDWGTDLWLAAGKLKDTNRYKEADQTLRLAKDKYKPADVTVAGHSLGGAIAGYIASKNDHVYTLDKGATIGQRVKQNENAYRTSGDVVSLLNANSTHMKTLKNTVGSGIINSHDVDNIKNAAIFV